MRYFKDFLKAFRFQCSPLTAQLTKTWNEPKRLKTSWTDPKNIAKWPEVIQNFKIWEIWNFLLAFVSQISSSNPQIWVFWVKKYQLSNPFMKFFLYSIFKVLILHLTLVFNNFGHKSPNMGILGQKVPLSSLHKILPVPYFEGADFKSDIHFLWFLAAYYPRYTS